MSASSHGLCAAWMLSAVIAALTVWAGLAGLLDDGVYADEPVVVAVTRGSDLATIAIAVPLLLLCLAGTIRGSVRAHLAWLCMLAYFIYDYSYYVYGGSFGDLFLLHVTILVASVFALILALMDLDVAAIRWRPAASRWVAGLLMVLGASIVAMWGYNSIRFALNGQVPTEVLPLPLDRVHLGYAIDLTLFAPPAVLTAVLLWRRTAWGYVLGVVVTLYAGVYQLNFLAGNYLAADVVQGLPRLDWWGVALAAVLLAVAVAMLLSTAGTRESGSRRQA